MMKRNAIVTARQLEIGYHNHPVGKPLNFTMHTGEMIALIGKNGTGKSTLLRTLAGLLPPLNGEMLIREQNLLSYNRTLFSRLTSFVSTEKIQTPNMKIWDVVALGRYPYTNWFGKLGDKDHAIVEDALKKVGMLQWAEKNINEISDGERQRVMIARTLAQDTEIIILDEPTAFLDLPNRYEIIHILRELAKKQQKSIIFSTHDFHIALHEADKIFFLSDHSFVEGAPEDIVLLNIFHDFLSSSMLEFNHKTGDFRFKKTTANKIGLKGEGLGRLWTKKALERIGYQISTSDLTDTYVEVIEKNGKFQWNLYFFNEKNSFSSIYDLTLHLTNVRK